MARTISRKDIPQGARDFLDDSLREATTPLIVEDDGKPFAVVISPEEYERIDRDRRERAWNAVARIQQLNADEDPDEILEFVTSVVEEVRQEQYDAQARDDQSGH